MNKEYEAIMRAKMSEDSYRKLVALENEELFNFIGEHVALCDPDTVYMCDDSDEDAEYIRRRSLERGEEAELAKPGQTVHYDGYGDQARDKSNTRFLVPPEMEMGADLNAIDREQGLAEVRGFLKGAMRGKEAFVKLFCECPVGSEFAIGCAQISDSTYVLHSEDILYRRGYEHFRNLKGSGDFFRFCHSAGELDERGNSKNLDKRRIYQDLVGNTVYSVNDQYAGNSVGLKKHAMRLAIKKSGEEGWLCEHMFIMSCQNTEADRATYFCGAFPSACGKTATAMIPGEKVVGDDIAYFKNINGEFRAANVEHGIFGIIRDVNPHDDPVIYSTLQGSHEMIFSNVLVGPDNNPYWLGMEVETPDRGKNHSGDDWYPGKTDAQGREIPISHPNARYTVRLEYLDNLDPAWNDKDGVPVSGLIYGGRDSDTTVPVEQSHNWDDGIILKACTLESETTAATLGQEGVRKPQPMANLDFISYPVGQYIQNNLDFGAQFADTPAIFSTNYFLLDQNGDFCTSKLAKKVWLHWMEKRVHGELGALETPTGQIPVYEDLVPMFKALIDEDYAREEYEYQFSFRCDKWLGKIERAVEYFKAHVPDCPQQVYALWQQMAETIRQAREAHGDIIPPGAYR